MVLLHSSVEELLIEFGVCIGEIGDRNVLIGQETRIFEIQIEVGVVKSVSGRKQGKLANQPAKVALDMDSLPTESLISLLLYRSEFVALHGNQSALVWGVFSRTRVELIANDGPVDVIVILIDARVQLVRCAA